MKNEVRISITILNEQKIFLDNFPNKSEFIRIVLFEILPKMIQTFIDNNIEIDLTDNEINIIEKYINKR